MVDADREFPEVGDKRKLEEEKEDSSNQEEKEESSGEEDEGTGEEDEGTGEQDEGSDSDSDAHEYCCNRKVKEPYVDCTDEDLFEFLDVDGPGKESVRQRLRDEVFPKFRRYRKQVYESDGFDIDVDDFPGYIMGLTAMTPLDVYRETNPSLVKSPEFYQKLADMALDIFNEDHDTTYKDAKFVKANLTPTCFFIYYLTFTAVDPNSSGGSQESVNSDGSEHNLSPRRTFQARIEHYQIGNEFGPLVKFCRLKSN